MAEYKLGLDIGNNGFKIAGKVSPTEFKLECIKALATRDASDNSYVVQLDGDERPLYFGVGEPLTVQDKTKRPYLNQIVLLAVATIYGEITDCDMVKIGIGLPLRDYKTEAKRKTYHEEVKNIKQVSGYVNGKYYVFKVDISIYAEGFSAFYYLMPNLDKRYRWLIVDHGYRTTDAVGVSYDSTRNRWVVDDYDSLSDGLLEIYQDIAKAYSLATGEDVYEAQDVEYYMRENIILMTSNPECPEANLNDYSYGSKDMIDTIYRKLATKFKDISARKILLLGGGGELVHKHLDRPNKSYEENITKRLYGNAIGFYLQIK